MWRLSETEEEGLLAATSHVWASLGPPKSMRCTLMGRVTGTGGSGKKALYGVLARFLADFDAETQPPPLPSRKDYATTEEWQEASSGHFAWGDAAMDRVITRYVAILDGGDPYKNEKPEGVVIQGPWKSLGRAYHRKHEREQRRARTPDLSSPEDRLRWLIRGCESLVRSVRYWDDCTWVSEMSRQQTEANNIEDFVTVLSASGWVCEDTVPDFDLLRAIVTRRATLGAGTFHDLYRYTNTLISAEADGDESYILVATRAGVVQAIADRAAELLDDLQTGGAECGL